jgi:hypothetical protein
VHARRCRVAAGLFLSAHIRGNERLAGDQYGQEGRR